MAIAINDKTRPVPHDIILPPLLDKLENNFHIPFDQIFFVIASGTHTPMPKEEFSKILPEFILQRYKVMAHDCDHKDDLIFIGNTSRGTPIWVNRWFFQANYKIVIGNLEPHHFMGFSGGIKSAAIGLTARETITQNHSLLLDPLSKIGEFESNPMRQEVEEIGRLIHVDLALNVILNLRKQIIKALSGSPEGVMLAGIPIVKDTCQTNMPHPYDLVIASAGGHPKDINLYQAQKALTNAAAFTKDGGCVLLFAECSDGLGSIPFQQFLSGCSTPDEVIEKFARLGFQVGPHKAYQIAKILKRVHILLLSSLKPELVRETMLIPVQDIENAWEILKSYLPPHPIHCHLASSSDYHSMCFYLSIR